MALSGTQHAEFVAAMVSAFTDEDELALMFREKFGARLNTVVGGRNLTDVVNNLIEWAESKGRVGELVTKACEYNLTNAALKAFKEGLARQAASPLSDPHRACLLGEGVPFVARDELRDALRNFFTIGRRVLVVNGPTYSGKTYSLQMINHLSEALRGYNVASISLKEEGTTRLSPHDVAASLAYQMGFTDTPPARAAEMDSRWAKRIRDWLIGKVRASGTPWVFVFDGFDDRDLPDDTHELIHDLIVRVGNRSVPALRLVLLSYRRIVPDEARRNVRYEVLSEVDRGDVRAFFETLYTDAGGGYEEAALDALVDEVFSSLPATRKEPWEPWRHLGPAIDDALAKLS